MVGKALAKIGMISSFNRPTCRSDNVFFLIFFLKPKTRSLLIEGVFSWRLSDSDLVAKPTLCRGHVNPML